jgi:hypothetical protein
VHVFPFAWHPLLTQDPVHYHNQHPTQTSWPPFFWYYKKNRQYRRRELSAVEVAVAFGRATATAAECVKDGGSPQDGMGAAVESVNWWEARTGEDV